jgi:cryptochrome
LGAIPRPILALKSLPDPGDLLVEFDHDRPEREPDINSAYRKSTDESYANIAGPKGDFSVPALSELGFDFDEATTPHHDGETVALQK